MAASPSSSAVPSAVVKQEQQPQDVKSEIFEFKEVKKELMEGVKVEKKEPKEEPVEGVKMEPKEEPVEGSNEENEESEEGSNVDMDDDNEKAELARMKRYEAEYTQYLKAKYFSDKTSFGGNIFDTKTTIGGETIAASRLPPSQSFADPTVFLEQGGKVPSSSKNKTPATSTSKGKSKVEDGKRN